jgi:hypothetical protein
MAKWEIEYYNEDLDTVLPIAAEIDQIYQELDGDINASFWLLNTNEWRSFISSDKTVFIYFDGKLQFAGIATGGDIQKNKIKVVCYDPVALILDQFDTFTGVYDQKPANTILSDVLNGTGLTLDASTPITAISVVFYNANRLDIIKFIASTVNQEYWSEDGVAIKWGTRGQGNLWTPTTLVISKRGIDRSKQVDCVRVRGIDQFGYHIIGVAGTQGARTKVFDETTITDVNGLNSIAAKHLAELSTDSSGAPLTVLMTAKETSNHEGADINVGDSVHLVNSRYLLNGNYRIVQAIKKKTKVDFQIEKMRKSIDKEIADLKAWENKGIYLPGSTSWSLNLQGLIGLFHLNEGEGTVAKNRAPVDSPIDGTITDGGWEDGPTAKILTFNGTTSVVDLGSASQAGINLTGKLSVGAWFSPSTNDSTLRRIVNKSLQFDLQYHVNTGVLTLQIYIGGAWHVFNSDSGIVTVGGRIFAFCTYDGAQVCMYVNGYLHKQWSQTGNPASATGSVYLGSALKGVLAEVMIWSRALGAQEVLELYFFPLFRVVGGGSSSGGWWCSVSVSNDQHGTTDPSGSTNVPSGQALVATATNINRATFFCWRYDGVDNYSTDNPLTIPAQADGSHHNLIALFTPPIGIGLPVVCTIAALKHTEIASPVLARLSTIMDTRIVSPVVASMSTTVSTSIVGHKWIVNCVNNGFGTFNNSGIQLVTADEVEDAGLEPIGGTLSYTTIKALHPSATASISAVVQSFKGNGGKLYGALFKIKKNGSPVGNLRCALYDHTGTYGTSSVPTGALIEDSADVAMAGLNSSDYYWTTFTFAGTTTLTAGTYYTIVVYAKSVTTLNTSNYIQIYDCIISSTTHQGNYSQYASSAWASTATTDLLFAVISGNAGTTLSVVGTPLYANGYVCPTSNPLLFDGVSVGAVAADGLTASYTIPEQIGGTVHTMLNQFIKGWGVTSAVATPLGYRGVTSGTAMSYTAQGSAGAGYHWHLWLDGIIDLGHSVASCPAQTNGTYHVITQVATPN